MKQKKLFKKKNGRIKHGIDLFSGLVNIGLVNWMVRWLLSEREWIEHQWYWKSGAIYTKKMFILFIFCSNLIFFVWFVPPLSGYSLIMNFTTNYKKIRFKKDTWIVHDWMEGRLRMDKGGLIKWIWNEYGNVDEEQIIIVKWLGMCVI